VTWRDFLSRTVPLATPAPEGEEARIQSVYAKRPGHDARYSRFNLAHMFIAQERERRLLHLLTRRAFMPLQTKKILEIGCGTGHWLREFILWGARPENVTGVELLAERVAEARRLLPESVSIHCGNAARLIFPTASFDLVLQSMVFTSVLDPGMKQQMASEMLRVVNEDGLILWYDYYVNNPWNPDVQGVKKREIYRLFSHCRIELQRITLAPPLTRLIAPYSWLACDLLAKVPLLRTHYLGVIQKG
jgi:SAM-dependent methyltransferase